MLSVIRCGEEKKYYSFMIRSQSFMNITSSQPGFACFTLLEGPGLLALVAARYVSSPKSQTVVNPSRLGIGQICFEVMPYSPKGFCSWITVQLGCDFWSLFAHLSNLGDSSLPWDLIPLTNLRRDINFCLSSFLFVVTYNNEF